MNAFNNNYATAGNFRKPGLNLTAVNASGKLSSLNVKVGAGSTQFLVSLAFSAMAHTQRGAPATAELLVSVSHAERGANISVAATWFKKTPFHGPETIWLSNAPTVRSTKGWKMDKLGSMIDRERCSCSYPRARVYSRADCRLLCQRWTPTCPPPFRARALADPGCSSRAARTCTTSTAACTTRAARAAWR